MFKDDVDTNHLRPETIGSIYTSRDAITATIPKEYAEFAGIEEGSKVKWRPYCGPHGNYLVLHLKGEQPHTGQVEGIFIAHKELRKVDGDSVSTK